MDSDTQWAEEMLASVRKQVNTAWSEGNQEFGPSPIAVMIGDMRCPLVRTLAEEMGIAEHLQAAGTPFVRPMPCEAWSSFLEAFAPATLPLVMDNVEQNQILIIVIAQAGKIALLFSDAEAMSVNAPGGEA